MYGVAVAPPVAPPVDPIPEPELEPPPQAASSDKIKIEKGKTHADELRFKELPLEQGLGF
jgi:hypothetical protein